MSNFLRRSVAIQAENGLDFGNALAEAADRGSDSMAEAAKLANRMQIQCCLEILKHFDARLFGMWTGMHIANRAEIAELTASGTHFLAIAGQCGTSMCMQLPSV